MPDLHLLIEEAADELGRLEACLGHSQPALGTALQIVAVAELAQLDDHAGDAPTFSTLAAAAGDPLHDAALPTRALHWRDLIGTEERRMLGGAALASQRFAVVAPTLSTYTERPRLEAIWREAGRSRPVLVRALDAAAWSPTAAVGEAAAALLLCAGGRVDRVRILPFADVPAAERDDAIGRWRSGEPEPWMRLGLAAAARRARTSRMAAERTGPGLVEEDARLEPLGRAAISARRALAHLRRHLVASMPSLAEELDLSRPAAGDALERLVDAGLARELTGRARDRVYAWAAACGVAESLTPARP